MCKTGGPRCEYSYRWSLVKRKIERSQKFKEASSYVQEVMLKEARFKFDSSNSALVIAHLPEKAKWQTKAKPLPRRKCEQLSKLFPKPAMPSQNEALLLTQNLLEEYRALSGRLTQDENRALIQYSITMHKYINGLLREGKKPDCFTPEELRLSVTAGTLKKTVDEYPLATDVRVLYRHLIVPRGVTPREYAAKYFKVGERICDPGFMSTSEDPSYIRAHAYVRHPSNYVVYQVLSRKGVPLQRSEERVGDLQSWEKERLLPAGLKLRVVGVRQEEFSVSDDRVDMKKQFSSNKLALKPKRFTVVQLMDEAEIDL
jgi:hypothetical protein